MKSPIILLFFLAILSLSCSAGTESPTTNSSTVYPTAKTAEKAEPRAQTVADPSGQQKVSLTDVDKAEVTNEAFDRRIIRNASLTMEVDSTTDAQHRVTWIAESHGGFVVTSEAK
jgi:hypothetical protein